MCRQNAQLPALHQAIVERPPKENDLVAIRRAIQLVWVPAIDPERTQLTVRAYAESATLRGLQDDVTREWANAIGDALAERHGLAEMDETCRVNARVALAIYGATVEGWIANRCREPLGEALQRTFDTAMHMAADGARAEIKA
jgi:hypothetical protein